MKKLLFISLFLVANVNSDVDLGEDFAAGDLVTADAFNTKFNALNGVVGEIVDADLLGSWECTSYKDFADPSHLPGDGGNGQVGIGNFYSNTAILRFTENDTDTSLNSPKIWDISRANVLYDKATITAATVPPAIINEFNGTYSLIGNTLYIFNSFESTPFNIKRLSGTKIFLSPNPKGASLGYPNPNIICEIVPESE